MPTTFSASLAAWTTSEVWWPKDDAGLELGERRKARIAHVSHAQKPPGEQLGQGFWDIVDCAEAVRLSESLHMAVDSRRADSYMCELFVARRFVAM